LATDALSIHLIDKIGSLDDAVKKAAELAKLEEYHTSNYPDKTDWTDRLFNDDNNKGSYLDSELRAVLGDLYLPIMELRMDQQRNHLQARLPFATNIK
jgi:protease-4